MNRQAAEALVGSRVQAWTAANGIYIGTLVGVTNGKPWRGRVLIDGVCSPAQAFEIGRSKPRRGFRPGETIEVGGTNIKPTDERGLSYEEAVAGDLARLESLLPGSSDRHRWAIEASIKVRREQIASTAV